MVVVMVMRGRSRWWVMMMVLVGRRVMRRDGGMRRCNDGWRDNGCRGRWIAARYGCCSVGDRGKWGRWCRKVC